MAELNTRIILDGITLALREEYPQARISCDKVEQGMKPGSFVVLLTTAGQTRQLGRRMYRTPRFDVMYFPQEGREECYNTADVLNLILPLIHLPTGDWLRGTDAAHQVTDGVLHYLISYKHTVTHDIPSDSMEDLSIEEGA